MKTRIHFEVLNLSKKKSTKLQKNFVESCTINFMMQTAVMGTKYRSGFHFIFDLRINLKMIVRYPRGEPYAVETFAGLVHLVTCYRGGPPEGVIWSRGLM